MPPYFTHARPLILVGGVSLLIAAGAAISGAAHGVPAVDEGIRFWIQNNQRADLTTFFQVVSVAAAPNPLMFVALAFALLFLARRRTAGAAALTFAPAAAMAVYEAGKRLVERARPASAAAIGELDFSFPSAHATMATAVCCTMAYVFWHERMLRGPGAISLAVLIPLLVGTSRLYLGVHWATDVIGGWSAGLSLATIAAGLYGLLPTHA